MTMPAELFRIALVYEIEIWTSAGGETPGGQALYPTV